MPIEVLYCQSVRDADYTNAARTICHRNSARCNFILPPCYPKWWQHVFKHVFAGMYPAMQIVTCDVSPGHASNGNKENHSWCEWKDLKTVYFHTYQIQFVKALTFYPHTSHVCPSFSLFAYSYSIASTHIDCLFFFHTHRYSQTLYISNAGWRLSWELIFTVFSTHSGDRSIGIRGKGQTAESMERNKTDEPYIWVRG